MDKLKDVLVFAVLICVVSCDFQCVCNYNVEKSVFPDKLNTGTPLGYMYEFDCKPAAGATTKGNWIAIQFEKQVGYVETDEQTETQTCPGEPDVADRVPTTLKVTTMAMTTSAPTTATTTPKSTTTTTTPMPTTITTTPMPTTVTTTPMPTTVTTTPMPTTVTTTPMPTTVTTTPMPTTVTTTPMTTTVTTTLMPTTVTTTLMPTTVTTTPMPTTETTHTQVITEPMTTVSSNPYVTGVSYGCDAKYIQMASHEKGTLFTFDHNCYEIVPTTHTWVAAENDCVSRGGHLAHITSLTEHNAIFEIVSKYHGDHVWIGLNDRDHEEHFQWSSGDPVNYTNFYGGRKDIFFHGSEDCVAMWMRHYGGRWEDVSCYNHHYAYVCEFDAVLSSHVVTTPVPTISSNSDGDVHLCPFKARSLAQQYGTLLVQHGDSCYELLHNKVRWSHGENLCRNAGGHLATINNAAEQTYVEAFMKRHNPSSAVWIGLHDRNTEGHFEWISGDPITYTNWITGHQDNFVSHNEEDCIALIPFKSGVWDDIPCGSQGLFGDNGEVHLTFCEYETVNTATVLVG